MSSVEMKVSKNRCAGHAGSISIYTDTMMREFIAKDPCYNLWESNLAKAVKEKLDNLPTSIFTATEGNSAKVFYQDGSSYVLRNIQDITVQPLKGGDTDVCITYKEADKAISEGISLKRGEVEVVIRASFISKIVIDESDVQSVYYQKHLRA